MATPADSMFLRCDDCHGSSPVIDLTTPELVADVQSFLSQHTDCSFRVTMALAGPEDEVPAEPGGVSPQPAAPRR